MKHKKKKRAVTLIEIMIVIMLIGLIGGALAFNMRGSVDKGKIFKSEQNAARVYDALMMASASGDFNLSDHGNMEKVKEALKKSALIKEVDKVLVDGWGEKLKIEADGPNDLAVFSAKLRALQNPNAQ